MARYQITRKMRQSCDEFLFHDAYFQLMVELYWWFGARWLGYLGSPKMKGIEYP